MNIENLHTLIDRYETHYELLNGPEHNEKFKWAAIRQFQDVWFSDASRELPFDKKFKLATKECSFLIDGIRSYPTSGIVKMAEQRPEQLESLFENVLFAPYDSLSELQNHMDNFRKQINAICLELFPKYASYKQDLHAVSCYLMLFAPEKHFIYRSGCVNTFARYTEFERKIGSGNSFSLPNLYDLSQIVVQALREHPTLMAKYDALFKDDPHYYYDESLHMMAYDLMYCCDCSYYKLYEGLSYTPVNVKPKSGSTAQKRQQLSLQQQEQQKLIEQLERDIDNVQMQLDELEIDEISLLGTELTHRNFGVGRVTAQQANKVTVQFDTGKTSDFVLSNALMGRLHFENDEDLLPRFGEYASLVKQKKDLEEKLENAKKRLSRLEIKQ